MPDFEKLNDSTTLKDLYVKFSKHKNSVHHILTFVSKAIPGDVWLQDFYLQEKTLTLKGYAYKNDDISAFIHKLNNLKMVISVEPKIMQYMPESKSLYFEIILTLV